MYNLLTGINSFSVTTKPCSSLTLRPQKEKKKKKKTKKKKGEKKSANKHPSNKTKWAMHSPEYVSGFGFF